MTPPETRTARNSKYIVQPRAKDLRSFILKSFQKKMTSKCQNWLYGYGLGHGIFRPRTKIFMLTPRMSSVKNVEK